MAAAASRRLVCWSRGVQGGGRPSRGSFVAGQKKDSTVAPMQLEQSDGTPRPSLRAVFRNDGLQVAKVEPCGGGFPLSCPPSRLRASLSPDPGPIMLCLHAMLFRHQILASAWGVQNALVVQCVLPPPLNPACRALQGPSSGRPMRDHLALAHCPDQRGAEPRGKKTLPTLQRIQGAEGGRDPGARCRAPPAPAPPPGLGPAPGPASPSRSRR